MVFFFLLVVDRRAAFLFFAGAAPVETFLRLRLLGRPRFFAQ